MGGANQYRETGEWAFEHQTELEVGSDGDLPLSRTTNQVRRFVRGDYCIVNEGGTAGFPVLHVNDHMNGQEDPFRIQQHKKIDE